MPQYAITPSTGVPLTQTHKDAMVQVGSKVVGLDGHDYVYARNPGGAQVAASTTVILTEPAMTFAAGAGAFTTVVAVPAGEFGWLRKTAI